MTTSGRGETKDDPETERLASVESGSPSRGARKELSWQNFDCTRSASSDGEKRQSQTLSKELKALLATDQEYILMYSRFWSDKVSKWSELYV